MTLLMKRPTPPPFLDDLPPSSGLAVRRWTPDERLTLAEGQLIGHGLSRLLNRAEYYALAEHGILGPEERTELIYGRVIQRIGSIGRPHCIALTKTAKALATAFGNRFAVEQQTPVQCDGSTEIVPDVAVFSGASDDYADVPFASDAVLLVEVSLATLRYDRGTKARLYAAAGVPDYWLLNLAARTLEVRRQPDGGAYQSLITYGEDDGIAPLSALNAPVRVADLLPLVRPEQNK